MDRLPRLLIPIVCLLTAAPVAATVLVPAEFREIVEGSDVIAYARIVDVRPQWVDGRRQISSLVTADVITPFKGSSEARVSFVVPGGQIGRYRSVLVGAPAFRRGEEAVLFLDRASDEVLQVFGLNQGVFRVRLDSATGRRLVVPPPLMAANEAPERVVRGTRRSLELEAFGAQVRAAMAPQPRAVR